MSAFTVNGIASGGSGSVTSIATTAPITGGTITTTGTLALQHASVTAGTYVNPTITVDQFGLVQGAVNGTGSIVQVVQTSIGSQFSTSSGSYIDITGFTASITPSSSSHKILVLVSGYMGIDTAAAFGAIQLVRGSTPIALGTPSGSQRAASAGCGFPYYSNTPQSININYLDSPATGSSVTYKLQGLATSGILYVGASLNATSSIYGAYPGTIILMEIVA